MKQQSKSLNTYLNSADSWARDRGDELRGSRRIAWIVAFAAVVVAVCEAFALMFLMPLKRIEPYTLMVDRQTGFVQLLKPLNPELVSSDAALTQSFLVQYVIAREGYDVNSLQSDYRKVALWSAGAARSDYLASMPASNPASPLARFNRSTVIDVQVRSVTSLGKNVAMVRFDTVRRDAGRQGLQPQHWVAVLRYGYSTSAMTAEDRFINPLGFQVARYRKNIEVLAAPEPAVSAASAAPSSDAASPLPQQQPLPQPATRQSPFATTMPAPMPAYRMPSRAVSRP